MEFITGGLVKNRLFAVGTDGSSNCVQWSDGIRVEWEGSTIACACPVQDALICISDHGDVWKIVENAKSTLGKIDPGIHVYGVTALKQDWAIAVGTSGSFIEIEVQQGAINISKASEFGFRKPGRDIINVFQHENGIVAIGKKELVYEFADYPSAMSCANSTGRESFFFHGTNVGNRLWLSGLLGNESILASYLGKDNLLEYHEPPEQVQGRAACLHSYKSLLLVANEKLFLGHPGNWRALSTNFRDRVVAIVDAGIGRIVLTTISGSFQELTL
jgi:hypothetical protein